MYLYFPHVYYNNDYFPRRVSSQVMTRFHINNRIFFTSSNGCPLHAAKSWQAIGRGTPLPKKDSITVSNLNNEKGTWGSNANIIVRMDEGQISTVPSWDSTASTSSMMMKFCKCEMTSDLYHLYFLQFASYQLRMSGTVNAKVHSGYFGQNKLMLIQQRSVNVYKFLENHTVILFHVSF